MTVSRKQLLVRLSTVAGVVVAVAGMVFVGRKLAVGWTEYREVIADARWGWLLVALPLAMVGMSSVGMVWRRIIIALGGQVSRPEIFVWYQLGQMAKYLPGGVWPMVGRSRMAVRGSCRSLAYNSVALSMGAAYLCATLVNAALTRGDPLRRRPGRRALGVRPHPDRAAGPAPAVLGKLFGLAERVLGGAEEQQVPPWTESVKLVLRHPVMAVHRRVDVVRGPDLRRTPRWSTWSSPACSRGSPASSWCSSPGARRAGGLHRGGRARPRPGDRRDRRSRLRLVFMSGGALGSRRRRGPAPAGAAIG